MAFAALGAIGAAGSSGMASAAQYQASKHERNRAWARMQTWEKIAPSLRVEGLRAAGLNPILAVDQGGGGGTNVPMGSAGGSPSFDPDPVGRVISSVKQARMMDSQVKLVEEELRKKQEEVEGVVQDNRIKTTTADLLSKFGDDKERLGVLAQFETIQNLLAERTLTNARASEAGASTSKLAVDRLLSEMGVSGARAMEEFYSKNPWARVLREFGGGSLVGTGAGAAAAAGGYLFGREGAGYKRHSNQDFGSLVPGHPKPAKRNR